jgi:hypothetical protein
MNSLTILLVAYCFLVSCASPPPPHVPQTTRAQRAKFKTHLIDTTIEAALAKPLTRETEAQWQGAFWGMELARYQSNATTGAIHTAFAQWDAQTPTLQRALLEVVYTVYPDDFLPEMEKVLASTTSQKLFAMAALQLLRASQWKNAEIISEQMQRRFPGYASTPILQMLSYDIQQSSIDPPPPIPPIADLLSAPFEKGKPVVFSLQRKNRRFSGLALVRDANGKFVKIDGSNYFSIPQLALALSNLPGYLTNGNTPQGIFSVHGFGRSDNVFIGPTENAQMRLPFEAQPFAYFHTADKSDSTWTKQRYENLLPESWRNYVPIYTAFYAGEAGRTEIIAHGTTVDPDFYKGEPFFPNAPTMGCLSAVESWSLENGQRVASQQQKLIDVMKKVGFGDGFLVLAELNDEQRAVTLEEVLQWVVVSDHQPANGRRSGPGKCPEVLSHTPRQSNSREIQ